MELLMFVGAIVGGVVLNMLASDLYDRCPKLAQRLLHGALTQLPEDQRERFAEEWAAVLMDAGSKTQQVWMALQFYFAAGRMQPPAQFRLDLNYVVAGSVGMVLAEGIPFVIGLSKAPSWGALAFQSFTLIPMTFVMVLSIKLRLTGRYTEPSRPDISESKD